MKKNKKGKKKKKGKSLPKLRPKAAGNKHTHQGWLQGSATHHTVHNNHHKVSQAKPPRKGKNKLKESQDEARRSKEVQRAGKGVKR